MPAVQTVIEHLPIDWIALGLLVALSALLAMKFGTRLNVAFALAAFLSFWTYGAFSNAAFLAQKAKQFSFSYAHFAIFLAIFVLLYIAVYRTIPAGIRSGSGPFPALLSAISAAIILAITLSQVPDINTTHLYSPLMTLVFGASYRFYWILAAYGILAINKLRT